MVKQPSVQESVGYWVTRLARSMEQDFESRLQALGITRGAYAALSAIHFDARCTPAELVGFLGIDGAAITRHLDRIEKNGLIERRPGASDRRSVDITLTPKGADTVKQGHADSRATNKKFIQDLSKEEVDALRSTIQTILKVTGGNIADV
jgi:MarR family transcriptional regulator for hemolysin